jgi:hypothetical protein
MGREQPRMVEWHRASAGSRIRRVLFVGPFVVSLGGVVTAASLLVHPARDVRIACTLAGLLLVAAGASTTIVGMQRLLREEVYLALRTDGLFVQQAGQQALVVWEDLERAHWDESKGELVLERLNAPPIAMGARFAGIGGARLVQRILAIKRKAAMNLLG